MQDIYGAGLRFFRLFKHLTGKLYCTVKSFIKHNSQKIQNTVVKPILRLLHRKKTFKTHKILLYIIYTLTKHQYGGVWR
jgi:hypothetical protein